MAVFSVLLGAAVEADFDTFAHQQGQRLIKNFDCRGEYLLKMKNRFNYVSVNCLPITTGATSGFV